MSEKTKVRLSREEIAKIEIGHTEVTAAQQWALSLFFLAAIIIYPVCQFCSHQPFADWRDRGEILASIKAYETTIEDNSLLRKWLLAPAQRFMTGVFRTGNEKVIVGRDVWLFFSGDYEYLVNPGFLDAEVLGKRRQKGVQPDPVKAISDFNRQLKSRGIRLVLVPVPVKPMIYADKLGAASFPLQNPSFGTFKKRLEAEDIAVVDLTESLAAYRRSGAESYLKTDTHWTPEAMEVAALLTARAVKADAAAPKISSRRPITNLGDIAARLKIPDCEKFFSSETVKVADYKHRPDSRSEVLLLGDSFANIYSLGAMKWGENGGFAEALGACLGAPVDALLRNDAGAFATRQLLAGELKRGRDRLAGKKTVIWEFAIRELANGDWKIIELPQVKTADGNKTTEKLQASGNAAAGARIVDATVLKISTVPRPNSAPYKDHVVSIHLAVDNGSKVLVYAVSMRDNIWTPAAKLRTGDRIKIKLEPWEKRETEFGSWNRSEFDDEELLLADPFFGEIISVK